MSQQQLKRRRRALMVKNQSQRCYVCGILGASEDIIVLDTLTTKGTKRAKPIKVTKHAHRGCKDQLTLATSEQKKAVA